MNVSSNDKATTQGPTEWFTGAVHMDTIVSASDVARINASFVHFAPGARTAWHSHPRGQTIYVIDGVCRAQGDGGPLHELHAGQSAFFEPGERHWHGASPTRFMTHLSLVEVDDSGTSATWGDHVTDDEYERVPGADWMAGA